MLKHMPMIPLDTLFELEQLESAVLPAVTITIMLKIIIFINKAEAPLPSIASIKLDNLYFDC